MEKSIEERVRVLEARVENLQTALGETSAVLIIAWSALMYQASIDKKNFLANFDKLVGGIDAGLGLSQPFMNTYEALRKGAANAGSGNAG